MNQKCFYVTGTASDVSDYINDIISNGWQITSVNTMPNGNEITAVVIGEVPKINLKLNINNS